MMLWILEAAECSSELPKRERRHRFEIWSRVSVKLTQQPESYNNNTLFSACALLSVLETLFCEDEILLRVSEC
jgi:hypothetical protein